MAAAAEVTDTTESPPRISTGDRLEVKQFFYARGVLALNAEQEADSVLAHLARTGELAAILTSDMDFVPRGVEWVLLPDFRADMTQWRAVHLTALLEKAKLTYPQFVDMCVLMGCDYAPYIPTISYQSAYWLIRSGKSMLDILAAEGIRTATAWDRAVILLKGTEDRWDDLLCARQREKWAAGPPPAEPDADILRMLEDVTGTADQ
jgi:5'-3' exonuclease